MTSPDGKPADLGHGIKRIPLPLPMPRLPWVNAYVVEGESELALIDCGVDTNESWDALTTGLEAMDRSVADISLLIGTHLHFDHIAMAERVTTASGARFMMHRAVSGELARYDDWSLRARETARLAERSGAPPHEVEEIRDPLPRPPWVPSARPPDGLVDDGDTIALGGGRSIEVLYTPGHEPAHICLIDSRTGVLFSGDHVLARITPMVAHAAGEDRLGQYTASLGRIEDMGIGLTYPAHGAVLERGSLRARQIILHHERRLGSIIQELRHGPMTAWELMEAVFRPNLLPLEKRLAFSETMAHLDHLVDTGQILLFTEDDTAFYRVPPRRRHGE